MDVNEGSGHTADDGTEERLTMPSQETSSSQPSTSSKLCCLHNEDETLLQSKIMKFIKDNFVKKVSTSAINIMKNITGFDKNRTYTGVDLEHMFGTLILVLEAECSKFLNNEFLTSNQTASHSTDAPQLLFLNSSQLTQPETTPPETQTTSNNSKTHVHSDELDAYDNNDDDDDDHQLESNLLSDEQLSSSSSGVHSPSSDQDDQPAAADNLHASSTSSHPTELQTSSSGDQTTVIIHLPSSTSIPEVAATESSETPTTETAEPLPEGGQPSIGLEPNDQVKDEAIDLAQILFGDDDESDFHDAVSSLSGLSVDEQCGDKPSDTAQVDSQLQGEDGHDENVNISANDDDDEEPERRCKKLNTDQRSNQRKDGDLNKRPKPLNDGRISIPDIEKELRLQSNLREQSNFEDISSDDSKLDLVFETSPSTSQRSENENSPNDNVSKETDELVSNSNTTAETDHPNEHIIEAAQEDQSEQSLSKDSDPLNNNDDNEEEEEDLLEPYVNENQPDIFGEADEDRQIVENIAQFGFESMHSDNENIEDLFEPWVNENLPDLFREANDDEGADDDDDDDDDDEGADDDNADEEMENTAGDEGDAENDASLADDSDHHEHDDDEEEAAAATAAEQSDNEANVSDAESENALVLDSNSDNEAPNSMYTQIRSIIQSANRLLNGSPKTAAVGTNKTTEKKPTTAQTEANNVGTEEVYAENETGDGSDEEEEQDDIPFKRRKKNTMTFTDSEEKEEEEEEGEGEEEEEEREEENKEEKEEEKEKNDEEEEKKVKRRRASKSSSSTDSSEETELLVARVKRRKRKRIVLKVNNSTDDDENEDDETSSKNAMLNNENDEDDDDDDEDYDARGSSFASRKRLKRIISPGRLLKETRDAGRSERERRRRIEEKQKLYNRLANKSIKEKEEKKEEVDEKAEVDDGVQQVKQLVLDIDPTTQEVLVEVNPAFARHLKPHQAEGIQFLFNCTIESVERLTRCQHAAGGILAHTMGLGKTFQVIAFLHTVMTNAHIGHLLRRVLIIVPLNVVQNWGHEFDKWFEKCRLERSSVPVFAHYYKESQEEKVRTLARWEAGGGVLLCTTTLFNNFFKNEKLFSRFRSALLDPGPDMVIIDEGHMLKNDHSVFNRNVWQIKTLRRVILTGTPLQNNLSEYYTMVSFVKPNLLGTKTEFQNRFENPIKNGQHVDSTDYDVNMMKRRVHILYKLLKDCIHRRDNNVLVPYLQPKYEYVLSLRLTELQERLYKHYLEQRRTSSTSTQLFSDFTRLSSIWNHPALLLQHYRLKQSGSAAAGAGAAGEDPLDDEDDEAQLNAEQRLPTETAAAADPGDPRSGRDCSVQAGDFEGENIDTTTAAEAKVEAQTTTTTAADDSDSDEIVIVYEKIVTPNPRLVEVESSSANAMEQLPTEEGEPIAVKSEEVPIPEAEMVAQPPPPPPKDDSKWMEKLMPDNPNDLQLSAKFILLFAILEKCEMIGDKILIFSQSLATLDLIETFLKEKMEEFNSDHCDEVVQRRRTEGVSHQWVLGVDYFRIDGKVSSQIRTNISRHFNNPANHRARLLLISTRAGGLGINLVGANRCVIFDASWNPANDMQAIYRIFRFGQVKPVYVYRFTASGTMESKIYERQILKQSLSHRVIDEQQVQRHFKATDVGELFRYQPGTENKKGGDQGQLSGRPLQVSPTAGPGAGPSGPGPGGPGPSGPRDILLAEVCRQHRVLILSCHEHDSLLESRPEEELTEEERQEAWTEYEKEKEWAIEQAPEEANEPPPGPNSVIHNVTSVPAAAAAGTAAGTAAAGTTSGTFGTTTTAPQSQLPPLISYSLPLRQQQQQPQQPMTRNCTSRGASSTANGSSRGRSSSPTRQAIIFRHPPSVQQQQRPQRLQQQQQQQQRQQRQQQQQPQPPPPPPPQPQSQQQQQRHQHQQKPILRSSSSNNTLTQSSATSSSLLAQHLQRISPFTQGAAISQQKQTTSSLTATTTTTTPSPTIQSDASQQPTSCSSPPRESELNASTLKKNFDIFTKQCTYKFISKITDDWSCPLDFDHILEYRDLNTALFNEKFKEMVPFSVTDDEDAKLRRFKLAYLEKLSHQAGIYKNKLEYFKKRNLIHTQFTSFLKSCIVIRDIHDQFTKPFYGHNGPQNVPQNTSSKYNPKCLKRNQNKSLVTSNTPGSTPSKPNKNCLRFQNRQHTQQKSAKHNQSSTPFEVIDISDE